MLVPEKRIADFEKMGFGMFVYDLGTIGSEHVVGHRGYIPERAFTLSGDTIGSIIRMDNDKQPEFEQQGNDLKVNCTGYDYGCDYCARVAKATIK
ncbi:MAG: hypothetical protein IJ365_03935 [Clostridia bacterium]|nr:hypothetical protein [Clostridia bacterium]